MTTQEMTANAELIRNAYTSFNARDIDAILKVMDPGVKWARAWEGDYAHGYDEVRAYWQRQWQEINPRVTPTGFSEAADGRFVVTVDQLVKDMDGNVLFDGIVRHTYTIADGFICQMDITK